MTDAMLAMFALGVVSALPAGWAIARWQLARHSALLNDAVRDGTTAQYRTMKDGRSEDRYPKGRYAEEGGR